MIPNTLKPISPERFTVHVVYSEISTSFDKLKYQPFLYDNIHTLKREYNKCQKNRFLYVYYLKNKNLRKCFKKYSVLGEVDFIKERYTHSRIFFRSSGLKL